MKYITLTLCIYLLFTGQQSFAQKSINDSVTVAVAPEYDKVSKLHRILLGENYRKLWAVPVKLKVFHLSKEKGGLTIEQQGGGMQTKSLRLKDKQGHEWVLRTVQKFAERVLPPNLRHSVARDILQDQVSTANPFAALTVPPLADALDIKHANPQIVYVPDDPALGKYRKDFANKVFLFEEREPLESEDTDNTKKVQKELKDDNDTRYNAKLVLRARLLDMILGDWDRHDDQWRWDKDTAGKGKLYTPIPRDRDQVYYKTSGVFPWIVSHQWLKSKFQPYHDKIRDIKSWNLNGQYFDRYFLVPLGENDWKEQLSYVKAHLTDAVIENAFERLPPEIYKLSAPQLISTMKARRDNMMQQGIEYYRFLSQIVEIPMSDKKEHFSINEASGGTLELTVYKINRDNELAKVIYQRVFDPQVTKEVRLYGFDGKDVFKVTGAGHSPIKVRMIGGSDTDTFIVSDSVNNKGKLFIYDRSDKKNILPSRSSATLRLSKDTSVNKYEKDSYQFDRFEPIILAQYNNDYGISIVGGFAITKHGFRKEPYASRNEFLVDYSLARHSFEISYKGVFTKAIGNNNLIINAKSRGPNSVNNFFGVGNETPFLRNQYRDPDEEDDDDDNVKSMEYYRNRYDLINADIRLSHRYGKFTVNGGLTGQFYTSSADNNKFKFLGTYNVQNPSQKVFSNQFSTGIVAGTEFDTRNSERPTRGIYWTTNFIGLQNLNEGHRRFGQFFTEFNFYLNPGGDSTLIIANRTGLGTTIGNADYYQQLKLGGIQTLRGYHTWRFTGKTMLYNGLEFRLKVLDFNSYLFPGSIGITGFNDVGRVWVPDESSSKWHDGYGGGIYINPAELISIQFSQGFSTEGSIHYFSLNYRF
ncbi:hypothetical protein ACFQZX_08400 [Mucilaginibacter litoreus]|uniref:Surface antigen n=1 Tax=Mucilaginibacter litoreus TaxID=1048221 RepID=A0ABW3ASZ1_9SPHI